MKLWYCVLWFAAVCTALGDDHWINLERPTTRNLNSVCFIDSLKGWVAGDSGTILKTTDGGETWKPLNPGLSNNIHRLFMLNDMYGWALALQYPHDTLWYGTFILKTTDGGTSWTQQPNPDDFFQAIIFFDSANGFVGGDRGKIRRTTDGGLTWLPVIVDTSIFMGYPVLNFSFFSRTYGFAMGGRMDQVGVMWKTINGGDSWTTSGPAGEPVHSLHYVDSLNLVAVGGDLDFGSGMIRSKDGGKTWEYSYLGIWGEAKALSYRTPAEGWAVLGFSGTYMVTSDTGRTWHDFYTPDSGAALDMTFADPTHGYMVGGNGMILKYNSAIVSVKNRPSELPATQTLYQNYPNPFNPSTVIDFELSDASFVEFKVYDATGREVKTLLRGKQEAGHHTLEFNGEGFASGIYFYQLTTNNSRGKTAQVKKMTLLR